MIIYMTGKVLPMIESFTVILLLKNLEQLVRSYPRYVAGTYELYFKWIYM